MQTTWRCAALAAVSLGLGCGGEGDDDPEIGPPDDVDRIWDVVTMTCDGSEVEPTEGLHYRFDATHVIRVERSRDDDEQRCLIAYVYDQVVSTEDRGDEAYERSAVLSAAGTKTTCWAKEGSELVEPPVSDELGEFGPEAVEMSMVRSADGAMTLALEGSPSCDGALAVELTARKAS